MSKACEAPTGHVYKWVPLWAQGPRNPDKVAKQSLMLFQYGVLTIFDTRKECAAYIKERFGYIAKRPDLRAWPHDWCVPRAVRVHIEVTLCPNHKMKPKPLANLKNGRASTSRSVTRKKKSKSGTRKS